MRSANATQVPQEIRGSEADLSRLPRLAVGRAVEGSVVSPTPNHPPAIQMISDGAHRRETGSHPVPTGCAIVLLPCEPRPFCS